MPLFIGVDIGGTKVLATAVSSAGRVLRTATRTTPGRRVEARLVEDALTEAVQEIAGVRRVGADPVCAVRACSRGNATPSFVRAHPSASPGGERAVGQPGPP